MHLAPLTGISCWCPRPDSNRHGSFPPRDFKSRASTNSATRAFELRVRSSASGDKKQSTLFDYELRTNDYELKWRRRADLNRCIAVLQTAPLATWVRRRIVMDSIISLSVICQDKKDNNRARKDNFP